MIAESTSTTIYHFSPTTHLNATRDSDMNEHITVPIHPESFRLVKLTRIETYG